VLSFVKYVSCFKDTVYQDSLHLCNFYPIILFNLVVPMLLSLVGGPRSGNGRGSPNHI